MGPNEKTYQIEDFGKWMDEQNIAVAFVDSLSSFESPKLKNLFSFNNSRIKQRGKRFSTLEEAISENQGKKLIVSPIACHIDWDKLIRRILKRETQTFPFVIEKNESFETRVFLSESELDDWIKSSENHLCAWPTEILRTRDKYNLPETDIDVMISVANGLCAVHKACLYPQLEEFHFIDISARQLEYTEWLTRNWDGFEPFHIVQKRFSGKDIIENRQWMYETAQLKPEEIQDALLRMRNATFAQGSIIPYKHPEPAIYYVSNAIDYWVRSLEAPVEKLREERETYPLDKEIVFYSDNYVRGTL